MGGGKKFRKAALIVLASAASGLTSARTASAQTPPGSMVIYACVQKDDSPNGRAVRITDPNDPCGKKETKNA